jgi:hypothetical protein
LTGPAHWKIGVRQWARGPCASDTPAKAPILSRVSAAPGDFPEPFDATAFTLPFFCRRPFEQPLDRATLPCPEPRAFGGMKIHRLPFAVEERRTGRRPAPEQLGELFGILTEVDGAGCMEGICSGEKFTAILDKSKRWGSDSRQWRIYKRGSRDLRFPVLPVRSARMSDPAPKADLNKLSPNVSVVPNPDLAEIKCGQLMSRGSSVGEYSYRP